MFTKSWLYFLLSVLLCSSLSAQNYSLRKDLLDEHIELGKEFHEAGDHASALMEFNLALGYLKSNASHDKRAEISSLINEAKAKLLDSKKRGAASSNSEKKEGLIDAEEEPKDFTVLQIVGKALARNVWTNKKYLTAGDTLGIGRLVAVLPQAGIEISERRGRAFGLRSAENSAFTLAGERQVHFHSGKFCFFSNQSNSTFEILSSSEQVKVQSDQPFVLLVEVLTGGNLLFWDVLGTVKLTSDADELSLRPGQMTKKLTGDKSKVQDFELSSSQVKQRILCGLKNKPAFYSSFIKQASLQAAHLRRRY
jgi:hypothetical protein